MIKLATSTLLVAGICFCNLDAHVTPNPSNGTYTVDPSGSVERKKPKCDIKKTHKPKEKHSRIKKPQKK